MAAKVRFDRGAWWVFVHHAGRRTKKRFGATAADKRMAESYAAKVEAALVLRRQDGQEIRVTGRSSGASPVACAAELRKWQATWAPTFKRSYAYEVEKTLTKHLIPHFGDRDLRELTEDEVLHYISTKLDDGYAPKTIENHLTVLRRVLSLLEKKKVLASNAAADIKALMARVGRATDLQTRQIDAWGVTEVQTLMEVAAEVAPRFQPILATAFYTGMRRGELLALQWGDVDFERGRIQVRRALVRSRITTPKNGRSRTIRMAPSLIELLRRVELDLKREKLKRGWPRMPEWVFPSGACSPIGERNLQRTWAKVRAKAGERGVRPLTFHCTRHTWASVALASGRSIKWIADQLGHRDVSITLNTYAHLMPNQEQDLGFLDFVARTPHSTAETA